MTQYEIIEMAKRAGIKRRTDVFFSEYCDGICFDDLETFAKLVAEKEREACAKVCETGLPIATSLSALDDMEMWGEKFAVAIRARGQE